MGTSSVHLRKVKKASDGGRGGRMAERSGAKLEVHKIGLECSSDCRRQPWMGWGGEGIPLNRSLSTTHIAYDEWGPPS